MSLNTCGMNYTGSLTLIALITVSALVRHCIEGLAPPYLLLHHASPAPPPLYLLCCAIETYCSLLDERRAFSVASPSTWNGLPATLRLIPVDSSISFLSALKTVMFDRG